MLQEATGGMGTPESPFKLPLPWGITLQGGVPNMLMMHGLVREVQMRYQKGESPRIHHSP